MILGRLLDDPAIRAWAIASAIVALKILAAGIYTSTVRFQKKVFSSPEDYAVQGIPAVEGLDADVERARRIHQNDLESALPFALVGFIYALTSPSTVALWICFAGYPLARILHSISYARGAMPHRTIVWGVGFFITVWMAVVSLVSLVF